MYIRSMYVLMVYMPCGEMELMQDNNDSAIGGGICSGDYGLSELLCDNIEEIVDYGNTSSNGLVESEPPCLVTNRTGERIKDNHDVPPFLIKLYLIIDDKATSSIISWGSSGTTFIIFDKEQFITMIMCRYFRTKRFESFLYQLNNYGFKKTWKHQLEFEHEQFQEGKLHWLKNIKRKQKQHHVVNNHINKLKATFVKVRHEQKQYSNKILHFKYDIEQTLLEVQTITKAMINKLLSTFSKAIGQKRTFLDMDQKINFGDIEKDFQSISVLFNGLGSHADCLMMLSDFKEKVITRYGENGGRGGDDGCRIPKFLHSLYKMMEKEEINDLISWNLPCCDSFIISDIDKFATHVLPMYFKHSNFSSFNSQLNKYGFKKMMNWEKHEYANEWFRRGRYDLLVNITRRAKNPRLMDSGITCSKTEVEVYNKRLKTIQDHQKNKIISLSGYEGQIKTSLYEFKETVVKMSNLVDKMMEKTNEKLENVKKTKFEFEKAVIGNGEEQELEVIELDTAPRVNNNQEIQYYFDELELEAFGIDPEDAKAFMVEWKARVLKDTSCSLDG